MSNWPVYIIALISGGIGVFAFSPYDYWGVTYLSLLGLIYIAKIPQKRTALWATFLWGVSFFSIGTGWLHVSIHQFGGSPLWLSYGLVVLLAAYLSLYPVLFTYLIQRFKVQSAVIFAAIWTFTEFLRGWVFTGFPWLQFGYSQIDSPFYGLAPIFGVTGLTFFTLWASAVIFNGISALFQAQKKWHVLLANMAMLAVIGGLSAYTSQQNYVQKQTDQALTITLAQGNIEQNLKWDPDYLNSTLEIYSRQIAENLGKTDLIILPESALPTLENHIQPFFNALKQAGQKANTDVIIGTVYRDDNVGKLLNSITVVDPTYQAETAQRYNKHHLVPFGEYVPLESLLRPLGSVFNLPMSAFQQGKDIQPALNVRNRLFTPAICYEIILGEQLRRNLAGKAGFILTVSNDAWFGDSHGPWQHLQMARMRALELGRPLVRATNTGISVFVNEKGNIIAQAPQFTETTLTQRIEPTQGWTPYAKLGNMPLYILSFFFIVLRALGALLKRKLMNNAIH